MKTGVDAFSLYLDPYILTSKALLLTLKYVIMVEPQLNVMFCKSTMLEI